MDGKTDFKKIKLKNPVKKGYLATIKKISKKRGKKVLTKGEKFDRMIFVNWE